MKIRKRFEPKRKDSKRRFIKYDYYFHMISTYFNYFLNILFTNMIDSWLEDSKSKPNNRPDDGPWNLKQELELAQIFPLNGY